MNPWSFLQGGLIFLKIIVSSFKSRVKCNFQVGFSNQKTLFLGNLYFLCRLYNLRGCLFQCELSNFCHGDRKLIFHVHPRRENCHLVLYELGIFQVRLDVRNLEKLKS